MVLIMVCWRVEEADQQPGNVAVDVKDVIWGGYGIATYRTGPGNEIAQSYEGQDAEVVV
jgi:hypothetical protein